MNYAFYPHKWLLLQFLDGCRLKWILLILLLLLLGGCVFVELRERYENVGWFLKLMHNLYLWGIQKRNDECWFFDRILKLFFLLLEKWEEKITHFEVSFFIVDNDNSYLYIQWIKNILFISDCLVQKAILTYHRTWVMIVILS